MKNCRLFLLLIYFIASPLWAGTFEELISGATGNTYIVSTESEFNQRAASAKPGDVILVKDGTYSGWQLKIPSVGTKDKPIIYTAQHQGQVTFQNGMWLFWISGSYNIIGGFNMLNIADEAIRFWKGASHNRITDCNMDGLGSTPCGRGFMSFMEQSSYNRIDNNYIVRYKDWIRIRLDDDAVTNGPPHHNQIDHNTIEDPTYSFYGVLQIGQGIGNPDSRWLEAYTIFEHNTVNNHYTDDDEFISIKCCNNIIRYNEFNNCKGTLNIQTGNYNEVYGNYIHSNRGYGIGVHGAYNKVYNNIIELASDASWNYEGIMMSRWGERVTGSHLGPIHDNIIANNTVLNCKGYGIRVGDKNGTACRPIYDCKVYNNIIVGDVGTLFHYHTGAYVSGDPLCDEDDWPYLGDGLNDVEISNNLFFKSGTASYGSGYDIDGNKVVGNPNLIDIFNLPSNSIAIDKGIMVKDISIDYYGNSRDSMPDIGAIEYLKILPPDNVKAIKQ
jgi:hypothetical protein